MSTFPKINKTGNILKILVLHLWLDISLSNKMLFVSMVKIFLIIYLLCIWIILNVPCEQHFEVKWSIYIITHSKVSWNVCFTFVQWSNFQNKFNKLVLLSITFLYPTIFLPLLPWSYMFILPTELYLMY